MGFLWIVTLILCAVLIAASGGPASSGVGFSPDIGREVLNPAAGAATLVVLLYYFVRFSEWPADTPPDLRQRPPRYYTTAGRYHLAAAIYGALMTTVFLALFLFPDAIAQLIASVSGGLNQAASFGQPLSTDAVAAIQTAGGPAPPASSDGSSGPQLSVFLNQLGTFLGQAGRDENWLFTVVALIIVIWPKLPFSRDDAIRGALQRFAAIPTEARGLMLRLCWNHTEFQPLPVPQYRLLRTTDLLDQRDFDALADVGDTDLSDAPLTELHPFRAHPGATENPRRIGYQFAKLLYLTDRFVSEGAQDGAWLRETAQPARYEELIREADEIGDLLRQLREDAIAIAAGAVPDAFGARFGRVEDARRQPVQQLLDFIDGAQALDAAKLRGLAQQRAEVKRRLEAALDRLHFHIVTSTLALETTPEGQRQRLQRLGFKLASAWAPLQESNALATLVALVLLGVMLPTLVYWIASKGLSKEVLAMQCSDLVLDRAWEPIAWSAVAVIQNVLAVITAFVLNSVMDRRHPIARTACTAAGARLDFATVTRRVAACLNAASLAFAVNLLLLAALLGLAPQPACGIDQVWPWAILPGIAGGFTALYLRLSSRNPSIYAWPLWQGFLSGLAAIGIGIALLATQSQAGQPGIDLRYEPLLGAVLGFALGFTLKFDSRRVQQGLIVVGAALLLPFLLAAGYEYVTRERLDVLPWLFGLATRSAWVKSIPPALAVFVGGFLLTLVSATLFAIGYRTIARMSFGGEATSGPPNTGTEPAAEAAPEVSEPEAPGTTRPQSSHDRPVRAEASGGEAAKAKARTRKQPGRLDALVWAIIAIEVGVLYGMAVHPFGAYVLGREVSEATARIQYAELSFLVYAYAAAASVGLLSGFFVLLFRASGVDCGKDLLAFMHDESFEVVLEDGDGRERGPIGVVPLSDRRAMVISVPRKLDLDDPTYARLPNGDRRKVCFKESEATGESAAKTASSQAGRMPSVATGRGARRIWMELCA